MRAIDLKNQKDRLLISLDKASFNEEFIHSILEKIRIEYLAQKVDFERSVEEIGEEIKGDWWKKNKAKFLRRGK